MVLAWLDGNVLEMIGRYPSRAKSGDLEKVIKKFVVVVVGSFQILEMKEGSISL